MQTAGSLPRAVFLYISIIAGGQVLLPAVVATFLFSRRVTRHATLVAFLAYWILYSLAVCILLYSGHAGDAAPPHAVCFAQVALIHGTLILVGCSAVALVLQIYLKLASPVERHHERGPVHIALLAVPPVAFVAYETALIVIGIARPDLAAVEMGDIQCQFQTTGGAAVFSKITPILVGLFANTCLVMTVWMFVRTVRAGSRRLKDAAHAGRRSWLRILVRFMIFSGYSLLSEAAALLDVFTPQGATHDYVALFTGTLPLAAFVVFGTLPDIRMSWKFWGRRPDAPKQLTSQEEP